LGSLYGAIIGTVLFVFVESYSQLVIGRALSGRGQREPAVSAGFDSSRPLAALTRPRIGARVCFAPWGVGGALKADQAKAN
jgi:hypothetical protein